MDRDAEWAELCYKMAMCMKANGFKTRNMGQGDKAKLQTTSNLNRFCMMLEYSNNERIICFISTIIFT